jgi:predicted CoA-binding protein
MPSNHEQFFQNQIYAVVGHTKAKGFPKLTLKALKNLGKTVFAVDPSVEEIEGEKAFKDLASLPQKVDGMVLEVPKDETEEWIASAAAAGIQDVWIHMQRDTPEAIELARKKGINVRTGTCAVMYVTPGFSMHAIHRGIRKLMGNY